MTLRIQLIKWSKIRRSDVKFGQLCCHFETFKVILAKVKLFAVKTNTRSKVFLCYIIIAFLKKATLKCKATFFKRGNFQLFAEIMHLYRSGNFIQRQLLSNFETLVTRQLLCCCQYFYI